MAVRCADCGEPLAEGAPWCEACGALADVPPPEAPSSGAPRTAPGAPLPHSLDHYRARLRETFGYPDFRGGQSRVLESLADRDVVAVMPTGSGKSLCYVLPALEVGRTVVVSPLIALMQDQVEGLQASGVPAAFINSNLNRDEQNKRYLDFIQGRTPLLYVAPERFQNQRFVAGLREAGVNLLAIDEAHCISEWGHNFRPDYLQLGTVRERLGMPRTLALTATANPQVRRDIAARLGLDGAAEVVTTVDRPNLTLAVERIDRVEDRVQWVIDYAKRRPGLAGIVYARTRRSVEDIAQAMRDAGVKAQAYHAGLEREVRSAVQRRFTVGEVPVIVATNAFGMGIDKPDVRYVIHVNMPGRLEAYTQEAGRAGRDGDPSECTLLYARSDRRFQQGFIDEAHPSDEQVRQTWQRWVQIADPNTGRLPFAVADDDPGYGMIVSALRQSRLLDPIALRITSGRDDAPIDTSGIARHRAYAEGRLREMTEYAETTGCRRGVILRYFGEEAPERCERCDNCLGRHEGAEVDAVAEDLYDRLLDLREAIARQGDRDPYRVFENRTAREIATYRPRSVDALQAIWGIGSKRASWFGRDVLAIVDEWEREHPEATPAPALPAQTSLGSRSRSAADEGPEVRPDDPLFQALRAWRSERAKAEGLPAYTVFSDRTLRELVTVKPRNVHALLGVWGLGESRVERFGPELVRVIREAEAAAAE
ncbi:MAG: RecQ family ATP-dependent DNA helicase [Dehalococcoidia bacterium]|nr:RecQ family ATP-dependent DNA helicase [Dehalococcoidia bacterium]